MKHQLKTRKFVQPILEQRDGSITAWPGTMRQVNSELSNQCQPFEKFQLYLSLLQRQRARTSKDRRSIRSFFLGRRLRIRTWRSIRAQICTGELDGRGGYRSNKNGNRGGSLRRESMQSLFGLKFYLQLNDDGPSCVFAVAMICLSDKTKERKKVGERKIKLKKKK